MYRGRGSSLFDTLSEGGPQAHEKREAARNDLIVFISRAGPNCANIDARGARAPDASGEPPHKAANPSLC